MSQNGKGDKRRPSKPGAYERGYEVIDWSKGRKPTPPRKASAQEVLLRDYTTKAEWVIPPLEEILGPSSYAKPAPEVVKAVCGGREAAYTGRDDQTTRVRGQLPVKACKATQSR